MNILISTGIYPPQTGGPATVAKALSEQLTMQGHKVEVRTYGSIERLLPLGLRHLWYAAKIIPAVYRAKAVLAFDTMSVGLPTVIVARVLGKPVIIRTGGDFLWESYVERNGSAHPVRLQHFYASSPTLSLKEKIIFAATRFTLHHATHTVFTTEWQRKIWLKPYQLNLARTSIIENCYGPKEDDAAPAEPKVFLGSVRPLVWKNIPFVQKAITTLQATEPAAQSIIFETRTLPPAEFLQTMRTCYAVILMSLGDISPNMLMEAIRYNRPFIATTELGIRERIGSCGIYVDPSDEAGLLAALRTLLSAEGYAREQAKVRAFNYTHTWEAMAHEYIELIHRLQRHKNI